MRWLRSGFALSICLSLLMLAPPAHAEKRIALLIGNQGYEAEIGRLANPHNDIALLERTLGGLQFEVSTVRDATLGGMHQAVNAYARRVRAAGAGAIGLFYYAGHGASDTGTNYLIPVDVKSAEEGDLWDVSLRLTEVTGKLRKEAANATHFVVFDACRNELKLRKAGSRALVQSRGFVPVAQEAGMLIAYATAEGELASDIGAGAGPYSRVLAEEIVKPGVEAVTMFRNVQLRVKAAIGQEPWIGFSALGRVHLAGLPADGTKPGPAPQVSDDMAALKQQLARLESELKRQQQPATAAPPNAAPSAPPPAAAPARSETPAATAAVPFRLDQRVVWRLQTAYPKSISVFADAIEDVSRALKAASGSTLEIDVLPAGAIVPPFEVLEATHKGIIDAAWATPSYWYSKQKSLVLFSGSIPFGLEPPAFVRWMEAEGTDLMHQVYSDVLRLNVRSLPCGIVGPSGEWFNQEVGGAGLSRRKFRATGFANSIAQRGGLTAVNMPGGEIVPALERGVIDSTAWSTPLHGVQLGLPSVTKFLYYPGWSQPAALLELLVNRIKWDVSNASAQDAIKATCRQNLYAYLGKIPAIERQGLDEARAKGVKVLTYPAAALEPIRAAASAELAEAARNDPVFAKVLASYNRYR